MSSRILDQACAMRFSRDGGSSPAWARDGRELFYLAPGPDGHGQVTRMAAPVTTATGFSSGTLFLKATSNGVQNLVVKTSNGAGNEEILLKSSERMVLYDWSRDGRFLLYGVMSQGNDDLWFLSLSDSKKTRYLKRDGLLQFSATDRKSVV